MTVKPMADRKSVAWRVERIDNDGSECDFLAIVMAATRGKAKTTAMASPLYDGDGGREGYAALRAMRAPEFDGGDLSDRNLIAHGWWFECAGCRRRVSSEIAEDEGWTLAYDRGGHVYCGAQYMAAHRRAG